MMPSFVHLLHAYGLWNRADPLATAIGVDLARYTRYQAADEAASARHGLNPVGAMPCSP